MNCSGRDHNLLKSRDKTRWAELGRTTLGMSNLSEDILETGRFYIYGALFWRDVYTFKQVLLRRLYYGRFLFFVPYFEVMRTSGLEVASFWLRQSPWLDEPSGLEPITSFALLRLILTT